MKTIKIFKMLCFAGMLFIAFIACAQGEVDPCIADPEWCGKSIADVRWINRNIIRYVDSMGVLATKLDTTTDKWTLAIAPTPILDSLYIKLGSAEGKGEILDLRGKFNIENRENPFIDFGSFGKMYLGQVGYLQFDYDFHQRNDKNLFARLTIVSVDTTGKNINKISRPLWEPLSSETGKKENFKLNVYYKPEEQLIQYNYSLRNKSHVKVELIDTNGRPIKKLVEEASQVGEIRRDFNVYGLLKGLYILNFEFNNEIVQQKINIY